MIPSSLAAVISFLLLLAPGIVWELQRARYEPAVKESTLVELSRVILVSLLLASISAMLLLRWAWIPLYELAQEEIGAQPASPVSSVPYIGAVLATSTLACGLAFIAAAFKWPSKAPMSGVRVWHRTFVTRKPAGGEAPYLIVELLDDTVWRGELLAFDADPEDNQRGIALGPPMQRKRKDEKGFAARGENWQAVILPESQIKSIQVAYPSSSEKG